MKSCWSEYQTTTSDSEPRASALAPALAISKGVDRARAVDESGNQLAAFGRRGARPLNREEAARLYLRDGKAYTVTADPPGPVR